MNEYFKGISNLNTKVSDIEGKLSILEDQVGSLIQQKYKELTGKVQETQELLERARSEEERQGNALPPVTET